MPDATQTSSYAWASDGMVSVKRLTVVYPVPASGFAPSWAIGEAPLVIGREPGRLGATIDDTAASRRHAAIQCSASDLVRISDLESKNGTFAGGVQVVGETRITDGAVIRVGHTLFVFSDVELPNGPPPTMKDGSSLHLAQAERKADLAARSDVPVLITGPTGAGKDVLARRIHERSGRAGELVAVNCATFSRELVASELFGHKRGAFSGAESDRDGLFVRARGGTLFLDEVADLPLEQQPALLRAIETGRVRPVGSDREVEVDARIIAATHLDIDAMVEDGVFRADLLGRLEGVRLTLPGLVHRREEILPIFAERVGDIPLTLAAAEALLLHDWPRNFRELVNAANHVKLFAAEADEIDVAALPNSIRATARPRSASQAAGSTPDQARLEALLTEHGGNVAQVARAIGEHRNQVYRWLSGYGLDPKAFRQPRKPSRS